MSVHLCRAIHGLTWRAHRSCHLSPWGCAPSPVSAVPEPEGKLSGRTTSLSCSFRWQGGRHPTPGEHGASACSVREDEWVNVSPHDSDAHLSGRELSRHLFIFMCIHRHSKPSSMFLKRGSDRSTVSFYAFTVRSFSFWCYRWQPLVGFSVLEKPDDIYSDTTATTENKPLC